MAKSSRLALIDYLKAICVVLVIITHSDFLNDNMLDKSGLFYLLVVNKAVPVFMFLSGYVFSLSAKVLPMREMYDFKRLKGKILRLFIPAVIAFFAFSVIECAQSGKIDGLMLAKRFFAGDFGRGSYYFPVMVEFTFTAPLTWYIIRKYAARGVVLIGGINLLYEVMYPLTNLSTELYRILVLRYLLLIAFGMYMAEYKNRIKMSHAIMMGIVGLFYILLPYAVDYEYKIFTIDPWNKSGMMSAFYVVFLMYVIFQLFGKATIKNIFGETAALIGRASYHIMYTQMMYFVVRPAIDKHIIDITLLPL